MQTNAIIVFVRHPTPGLVKTRLAKDVGDQAAAQFYKICAESILRQCKSVKHSKLYIFYSLIEEAQQVRQWLSPLFPTTLTNTNQSDHHEDIVEFVAQIQSKNLGDRLHHAFHHVVSKHTHKHIAVVGTDIPDITSSILQQAFDILAGTPSLYDIVFGPAIDGGYYLLALNTTTILNTHQSSDTLQRLFANIEWSTASVLDTNIKNAIDIGLRVAPREQSLPVLRDIDTIDDLHAWMHDNSSSSYDNNSNSSDIVLLRKRLLNEFSSIIIHHTTTTTTTTSNRNN